MLRKLVIMLIVPVLILTHIPNANAATVNTEDYREADSWATKELDKGVEYGLITDKIKVKMNANITREEFAELSVRLYEVCTKQVAAIGDRSVFVDTKNAEIFKAYNLKIVNGTNLEQKLYSPKVDTTRQEIAVMLFNTTQAMYPTTDISVAGTPKFSDINSIAKWAMDEVNAMSAYGFILGAGGRFNPLGKCKRQEAVLIAVRIYEDVMDIDEPDPNPTNDTEVPATYKDTVKLLVNDVDLNKEHFVIKQIKNETYLYVNLDMFNYSFKYPHYEVATYGTSKVDNDVITLTWIEGMNNGVLLQVIMKIGSSVVTINGETYDLVAAPYKENGKTFIPVNAIIGLFKMKATIIDSGKMLSIQYADNFPITSLVGTWSDNSTSLFTGIQYTPNGPVTNSSFGTCYEFNSDYTYKLIMFSSHTFSDAFIIQSGKYKIMGNTVMLYDIIQTLYKGNPYVLTEKNKLLKDAAYIYIDGYNSEEKRIKIDTFWLDFIEE